MSEVVRVESLSRRYRELIALDRVDLSLGEGTVLGLIGKNGAGKTTLIRHLLGLLRAQSGSVRVFGEDPVARPEKVLGQIGYLSEDRDLPGWMRVGELLRYSRAFYPGWDQGLADQLCRQFRLDPEQRIRTLSRGQHVRTGLVAALAPRPPLLVLDEPSSGLDPVVRRDVLETVLRTVVADGRTVLLSSHLLDEVERLSDRLALIDRGKIVLEGPLAEIAAAHGHFTVRLSGPSANLESEALERLPGLLSSQPCGGEQRLLCHGDLDAIESQLRSLGAEVLARAPASLDEIFLAQTAESA